MILFATVFSLSMASAGLICKYLFPDRKKIQYLADHRAIPKSLRAHYFEFLEIKPGSFIFGEMLDSAVDRESKKIHVDIDCDTKFLDICKLFDARAYIMDFSTYWDFKN